MALFQKCYDFTLHQSVKDAGIYPLFRPMEGSVGHNAIYQGKRTVMIGSNNYLGLTNDPRVKAAAKQAIEEFGTGCTGSRMLNGNSVLHDELEEKLATFLDKEAALVFTTGFLTNYGALTCLAEKGDFILSDAENHASLIAGCKSSKATTIVYQHNDMQDLEAKIQTLPEEADKLIVTDGVFSMTGAIAKLPEIVAIKQKYKNTYIYLDDAHGLGVLGEKGEGTAAHFGLTNEVDLIMGTFSKSFASLGGVLAGNQAIIDYVRHVSRGFIFSAAMPPASVAAVLEALRIMTTEPEIFKKLWNNVAYLKAGYERIGLSYVDSETPIISIFIGEEGKAFHLVRSLFEAGVFATPVVFPAVPFGQAMIRTSIMASHTQEELDFVLDVFARLATEYGMLKSQIASGENQTNTWDFTQYLNAGSAS